MPGKPVTDETDRGKSPQPKFDIVFYDGDCGFCHRGVRYFVLHDERGRLRFAPRDGPTFHEVFGSDAELPPAETIIFHRRDGRVFGQSSATIQILSRLSGRYVLLAKLLRAVPRPLRDFGYRCVARVRRKLFAKPEGSCPIVPRELRARFLP